MEHLDTHGDKFAVNLFAEAGEDYAVQSIEVGAPEFLHRITPRGPASVEEVFREQLGSYIRRRLGELSPERSLVSFPDDVLSLPDLTLGRVRLMVTRRDDGAVKVTLRFAHFVGDLRSAFAAGNRFGPSPVEEGERTMVSALNNVCLPLLNIADAFQRGALDKSHSEAVEDRLRRVAGEIEFLRFYIQLLAQHVLSRPAIAEFVGRVRSSMRH